MTFRYPPADRVDVVDRYGTTTVADPYRWLEDPDDPRTHEFVRAQNELTRSHLDTLAARATIDVAARRLWEVPRAGAPKERSGVRVRSRHDGVRQQPVLLIRRDHEPERVLVDPNQMTDDGTAAVVTWDLAPDGRHLVYSVADGGSDWQMVRVRRTEDGTDLDEELRYIKFTAFAWHGNGFFYSRFPTQDVHTTAPAVEHHVVYHELGTDQADDVEWFRNRNDPSLLYSPAVSDGGRYLVLSEFSGTSEANGLLVFDLEGDESWVRMRDAGDAAWQFIDVVEGRFLVVTDFDAPNRRIVAIPAEDLGRVIDVIPEGPTPLQSAGWFAGNLVTLSIEDASHRLAMHAPDGSPRRTIDLPAAGSVDEWDGAPTEPAVHLQFQSFAQPPTALCHRDGRTTTVDGVPPRTDLVVERHLVPSTDGEDVGMFLLRMAGASAGPTELYGYGGFNIPVTPTFDPARLAFLESGGSAAIANLRGGSERGERWHVQGMLGHKQQVFDDFIACARYLKDQGLATTVGSRGRSNGGLLTAATALQAPDAFDAVVSSVPVTDMLRYQHFTAGRYWTVEYGEASDGEAFDWLIAYSPYHGAETGRKLPPLLVTTALGDDRVVPMHAYKFVAAVQHAVGGSSEFPYLCRITGRAGHGLGTPTNLLIDEAADVYGFLLHHLS